MANSFEESEVKAKDVMNSPVVTINSNATVRKAAETMKIYRIGSVVVTDELGRPEGIITKTDIVERVVASGKNPERTEVSEIMSSPLIAIDPETPLRDVAKLMRQRKISRVCIRYKGRIVGIVTLRDVIRVAPELMSLVEERKRIMSFTEAAEPESTGVMGTCDNCGSWSENLIEIDGKFYCDECRTDLFRE